MTADVGAGEVVCIVGPNGAGKSTLLKALAGVIGPQAGSAHLGGLRIDRTPSFRLTRLGLGYVPQLDDVFEPLSVAENLVMGGYAMPRPAVAGRLDEIVTTFPQLRDLLPRTARKLSGGERKLVAVGRALMNRPKILLLDEPTANLSPKLAAMLLEDVVRGLAASGTGILLVEQRALAALRVANWAYVMVSGRVRLSEAADAVAERGDIGEIFMRGADAAPGPPGR
ncbi:MAG TPA: ATP-binding cassette domain-containing protein [Candidatus Micrarchaeia archaeon]|nr:ATP-binding cassette domain-containing protein [Candidatus Micrarchaeia archaeon]